jgi:acyl-CoA reductase-like NAD-dependent aldehyde dehydrogenase
VSRGERPRQFGRYEPFSSKELEQALEGLWSTLEVPEGSVLFREGDDVDALYLVVEGEVLLEVATDEIDTDATLEFARAGELLGEVGLLGGAPRAATARARSPVRLRRVEAGILVGMEEADPARAARIYRLLGAAVAARLHRSNAAMAPSIFEEADDAVVNEIMEAAVAAQITFATWPEPPVDALLTDLAQAVAANAVELGQATVDETGRGVPADKAQKIRFASLGVLGSLLGRAGTGVLGEESPRRVTEIAAPVGVVFAVAPITEPISTYVNKVLIALKARNSVIVSPHSGSVRTAARAHDLVCTVLDAHGAPDGLVQLAGNRVSRQRTARFFAHPSVGLILATGSESLVRAAYRSGRPAIGVGPGNAPVWITPEADLERAARCVVESKSFDYSLICGAEQHLILDRSISVPFLAALEALGTRLLTPEERETALRSAFTRAGRLRIKLVGRSARQIADHLGLPVDENVRLLAFWDDPEEPSPAGSGERLAPIVTLYEVQTEAAAITLACRLLQHEGKGHTAVVHTEDDDRALRFAQAVPVSRILVNVPASHGCGGALTGLVPSMSLGCGTFGGNSTTDNVGLANVQNVQRVARPFLGNLIPVKRLAKLQV